MENPPTTQLKPSSGPKGNDPDDLENLLWRIHCFLQWTCKDPMKEWETIRGFVEEQRALLDRPGRFPSTSDDVANPIIKEEPMPESTTAPTPDAPHRPMRSTELDELLIAVVDSPDAWLSTPSVHFGGRRPSDLVGTDEEYKVVDLLQAVDQGLF